MKYLFIDIRKSDEVYRKHFGKSDQYKYYNIPMNMIRFNYQNIIEHLEYFDEIYIVCQSGSRSQFIKNKYFSNVENVKVNKDIQFKNFISGKNTVKINNENINIMVAGIDKFNLYNVMRILQLVLGTIILTAGGYTYFQIKDQKINKVPLIILLIMGVNAVYNGLTSTCSLSDFLVDKLN